MKRRAFLVAGSALAAITLLPRPSRAAAISPRLKEAVPGASRLRGTPLEVVDTHVHLWNPELGIFPGLEKPSDGFIGNNAAIARNYPLEELLREGGSLVKPIKIVNIEALATDTLKETEYLQKYADKTGFPQGIVIGTDLARADAERELEKQATFSNVRGVRNILNLHPNPLLNYRDQNFMANPTWRKNFSLLRKFNMSFDMQLYPHQNEEALGLIREHPDTLFIINHAGMHADRTLEGWRQWRDGLRLLAAPENTVMKISGIGMLDHNWTVESFRPYVLECLDAFGLQRCVFASNFPVDKLFGTYTDTWLAFAQIIDGFSPQEQRALLCSNAERVYRI